MPILLYHRNNVQKVYEIFVKDFIQGSNSIFAESYISEDEVQIGSFRLEVSGFWLSKFDNKTDSLEFINLRGKKFVENLMRDFLYNNKIDKVKGRTISIYDIKEYADRAYLDDSGFLDFRRDPKIIANENRIARELVLKQLYFLQSMSGKPVDRNNLIKKCKYYQNSLKNAITTLISKNYIKDYDGYQLNYAGSMYIEEKLLSPYNNTVFLIAACNDEMDQLIKLVYKPLVESLGYELIFQEHTEPKGSIHEDIWEYIDNCKLVICDLSYKRPNCFIEYGYALAKKKQIILCVEENEGKTKTGFIKVPFDTQNQKYSFWKKEWLNDSSEESTKKYYHEIRNRMKMKLQILDMNSDILFFNS